LALLLVTTKKLYNTKINLLLNFRN